MNLVTKHTIDQRTSCVYVHKIHEYEKDLKPTYLLLENIHTLLTSPTLARKYPHFINLHSLEYSYLTNLHRFESIHSSQTYTCLKPFSTIHTLQTYTCYKTFALHKPTHARKYQVYSHHSSQTYTCSKTIIPHKYLHTKGT